MSRSGAEIHAAVERHAHKRLRRQALRLALSLLAWAPLVVGALAALAVFARPAPWLQPLAFAVLSLCVAGILVPALVALLRPVKVPAEAKRLDDDLALKDRLTSGLAFLARPDRTSFEDASVADALRHLDRVAAHVDARSSLRGPFVRGLLTCLVGCAMVGAAFGLRAALLTAPADAVARTDRERDASHQETSAAPNAEKEEAPPSDKDLVEVEDTRLDEEAPASAFDEAARAAMQAMGASETGEADRLLAQAAYLNESDLSDSGADGRGSGSGEDVMTMKEPDMDMIREMVKEAQERKKKGEDSDDGGDDINLEVLIKSQSAASGKQPDKQQQGGKSSGGGGPSQDTRIKPKRVEVARKVEFKITSMRSLTPPGETDAERTALSEAVMRTSGVPEPPMVKARVVMPREAPEALRPIFAQGVPAELRAYISRYFEGLRDLSETP